MLHENVKVYVQRFPRYLSAFFGTNKGRKISKIISLEILLPKKGPKRFEEFLPLKWNKKN